MTKVSGATDSSSDKECSKSGYVKEKVVAAAMLIFLKSNPDTGSKMFDRLDGFFRGKKKA